MTTFAIVASVAGSTLPIQVVILTGFAKLLGDGLSMGLGDCMSEQAEQNHIRGEHKREQWELENFPQGEIDEMVALYREKGFSQAEATKIISLMTKKPAYYSYFVEHMVRMESEQRLRCGALHVVEEATPAAAAVAAGLAAMTHRIAVEGQIRALAIAARACDSDG